MHRGAVLLKHKKSSPDNLHVWQWLCVFGGRGRGLCVFGGLCVDVWRLVHQWWFLLFDCFWLFLATGTLLVYCSWYSLGRHVTIGTPMVIFAVLTVLTVFWLFLTIGTLMVHGWYSLGRPVWRLLHQQCTNRHMSTKTVPIVKTVKRQSKQQTAKMTIGVPIVTSTQSPLNTQSPRLRPRPPSVSASAEYTKPWQLPLRKKVVATLLVHCWYSLGRPSSLWHQIWAIWL